MVPLKLSISVLDALATTLKVAEEIDIIVRGLSLVSVVCFSILVFILLTSINFGVPL